MNATREQTRVWTDVSALMALCAGLRLAFVWLVPRVLDSADAVRYLETARLFAAGDFFSADPKIPLLYPALIALAHQAIPDIESAGRAVSWIFSSLLVVPVYLLGRDLHGRGAARIAGVLVAFWPWLIDYGSRVATEPLGVFLWMCGVSALIHATDEKNRARWMFVSGLFFALLHLARPEGTVVYFGALGSVAILSPRTKGGWARGLMAYALPGLFAIVAGALYTHSIVGEWTLNYRAGFIGEQPEGSTLLRDFARTVVAFTSDVPAVMLGPLLWTFFGIGLAAQGHDRRHLRRETATLYFALLQWIVVLPVLSPAPRYLMASFVLLSLWSARGIEYSIERIGARYSGSVAQVPIALVLGWMVFHAGAQIISERTETDPPRQPWEYKEAGEWMREHLPPGPILTRKPQVGFYAAMPSQGMAADASLDEMLLQGSRDGFRYLVVDERYTAQLIPALKPLLDPANAPASLRLLNDRASSYRSARVVIYEFAGKP